MNLLMLNWTFNLECKIVRFAAFILQNGTNVLKAKESAANRKFTKKNYYVTKRI